MKTYVHKIIHLIYIVCVACFLLLSCRNNPTIEINNPIAVIQKKCGICHRAGEAGPFSLMTYHEIKLHANKIKYVIEQNIMPPWPADTNYSRFANELILTKSEKEKILEWIKAGCPIPDTNKIISDTTIKPSIARKPDLIIRFPQPIYINGNGSDHFFIVKMPYELDKDTFVQYVEFVPHQKKIIHHVNGHLLMYDKNRSFNYYKGKAYVEQPVDNFIETYQAMGLIYTDCKDNNPKKLLPALLPNTVYYLPGFLSLYYGQDIGGFQLSSKGVFFLNDIHYGPTHSRLYDSSYLKIYFAPRRPKRYVYEGQMGTHGMSKINPPLIIPPNTTPSFTTSLLIPADISILSINPHMHLLGKSFLAFAVTPLRDTIPLIRIPHWNFNWQFYYIFKHPVIIPKGSLIVAIGTFDNTSQNPYNPHFPPILVKEGDGFHSMKTTDEMFQFFFQYMIYQSHDDTITLYK